MRSKLMCSLLVVAVCSCFASAAIAQIGPHVRCMDRALAGQPKTALWSNSFAMFLDAHRTELSVDQMKLVQQAIDFGASQDFELHNPMTLNMVKGLLASARQMLTHDQVGEIMAGMGSATQKALLDAGAVEITACSCTIGGSDCPAGFPCTTGCYTWGTGRWAGTCKMVVQPQQPEQPAQQ